MPQLTAAKVKAVAEPGRYGDGAGLYLNVAPGGSKSWVQRIVVAGRRRDIGLGGYPTVGLGEARVLAAANRTGVASRAGPGGRETQTTEAYLQGSRPSGPPGPTSPGGATLNMELPGFVPSNGSPSPSSATCQLIA